MADQKGFKIRTHLNDVTNTYTACLEKDGSEFYGYGPTEQAAKDSAIKGYYAEYLTSQDEHTARQPTEVEAEATNPKCNCADLPRNIFQQEFIPNERDDSDIKFDFGIAIRKLKEGKRVMRAGWNGKGMFVYYVPAASYPVERNSKSTMAGEFVDDMVPYREYLALKTAQNDVSTWAPSVSDALAEDWQLA